MTPFKQSRSLSLLIALVLSVHLGFGCSWAVGYFHQVTCLRGSIVGVASHGWPRWIRQRVTRGNVQIHLYEYRWPIHDWNDLRVVKTVTTDHDGNFDFGILNNGHYTLVIDWPSPRSNLFDVEITALPQATRAVRIDVSPVYPDCTGGHEFIVYSE
jgi:hypothetical protein